MVEILEIDVRPTLVIYLPKSSGQADISDKLLDLFKYTYTAFLNQGEVQGMASRQMTIYVPPDLRALMDAEDENWSSIAQEAFRKRLAAIEHEKKAKTKMDNVIARLKASKKKASDEHFQWGKVAGLDWAKQQAEWAWLVSISRAFANPKDVHDEHLRETFENALFDSDEDEQDRAAFWEMVAGDDWRKIVDASYTRGFVEGVLDIYEAVKDEV